MKRLLLKLYEDGKHVGYEEIVCGFHYQASDLESLGGFVLENDKDGEYILFDSFEIVDSEK